MTTVKPEASRAARVALRDRQAGLRALRAGARCICPWAAGGSR